MNKTTEMIEELKIVYSKNWRNEEHVDIGATCMGCNEGPCFDVCKDIEDACGI